jgi:hypothetical protein
MYVKVLILSSTFGNYDTSILSIGFLHDLATDEEITLFNNDNSYYNKEERINLISLD